MVDLVVTVTKNRVSQAMTDVTITSSQLATALVLGNAQADPNTGKVNFFNKAMARGWQMALSSDEQIVTQNKAVQQDTITLDKYNKARNDWTVANFSGSLQDARANTDLLKTLDPKILEAAGVAIVDNKAVIAVSALNLITGTVQPLNLVTSYPAIDSFSFFSATATANDNGQPLQTDVLYKSSDNPPKLFVHLDLPWNTNVVVPTPAASALFRYGAPTAAELAAYKDALQKASDKLSQFSQTQQARLQQFVTTKSMWQSFITTLIQLQARMKGDIAGKLG